MSSLSKKTRFLVYTGVFAAISIILCFIEFPIIPGLNYLQIDLGDVPAAVAGVILGPGAAVCVELIKTLVHVTVKGVGSTLGFGDIINFLVGVALTVTYSVVYRRLIKTNLKKIFPLLISGVASMAAMIAAGVIGNYLLAPPYFDFMLHIKLSNEALWAAIGGATLLNVVKSGVCMVLMIPLVTLSNKLFSKNEI